MLNRKLLRDLSMNLRAVYYARLQQLAERYRAQAELVAMIVESRDEMIVASWLGELPVLRKWLGDRRVKDLAMKQFKFLMADFEATVRVHENDIRYDRLGLIRPQVREMARQTLKLPMREISALIADGFDGTLLECYDDLPLFSADHENGTNKGTKELSATRFEEAYDEMSSQKDANGEDMDITPTHLWYNKKLRAKAKEIIGTEKLAAGADNPNWKLVEPLPIANMPAGTEKWWGLIDLDKELKPFWWAEHPDGPQFVAMDQPASPGRVSRKEVNFGLEQTGGAAPGFPQLIWGSNGTGGA